LFERQDLEGEALALLGIVFPPEIVKEAQQ
jgi:hypothetical protein